MAQFWYLGTWDDSWQMLGRILERKDTRLVVDLWYTTAEPTYVTVIDAAAKAMLEKRRSLLVWAAQFSRFPPAMKAVDETRHDTLYTVQPTRGGPMIDMTLPACYEEDGFINLACGMCVRHRSYWNPAARDWEPPSVDLEAGYKDIIRRMKRCLVRHKFHKPIWVGRDALCLLKEGRARITGFGLERATTYAELMRMNGSNPLMPVLEQ